MRVREAVAAGFVRFGHVCSELNVADILTKFLTPQSFRRLAHPFLFRHLENIDQPATIPDDRVCKDVPIRRLFMIL